MKPHTGVERCSARGERSQRTHIGFARRAFVRREYHRFATGVSRFAAKMGILRDAVRAHSGQPRHELPAPATARLAQA